MSFFQWLVLGTLGFIGIAVCILADAVAKQSRHFSNIADRLLDIGLQLGKRDPVNRDDWS